METTEPQSPQPTIGVGAIVFDDRKNILLIRRNKPPALGQWSIPGGCQEPCETLVETAAREVLEETGITVSIGPIVAVAERIREGFHYVIIDFLATTAPQRAATPVPASDVSEACWVQLSRLGEYDMVDGLRAIIERVAQIKSKNSSSGLIPVDNELPDFIAAVSTLNRTHNNPL